MDTSSYLRSQGWLGTGHALNSHKPGLGLEAGQRHPGLAKPLTIPQKQNVFGVGKKQHDSHADQWWARAFDDVLKGVNAGSARKEGLAEPGVEQQQQPPRTNTISMGMGGLGKHGNLYGNFVRGEGLRGTFLKAEEEVVVAVGGEDGVANRQVDKGMKRRRQDGVDEVAPAEKKICKEESATNGNQEAGDLHASKVAVQASSISMASESAAVSSREQRRRQRQQQEARKAKELADVQHALDHTVNEPIKVNGDLNETKEERRQRRKEKGESKAAEAASTQRAFISTGEEPVISAQEGTETKAQRKQRREERRATKAATRAKPQIALKSLAEEPVSRNERGSETKKERRQRREERRARKATEKAKVAVHEAVVSAMPEEGLENGKTEKVVPDSRAKRMSAMTGEPSTVASEREKKARDERKKKKTTKQKPLV
ncbi:MAG: hypothetical protein OHK93_001449 [Ramalina farinacea]|uniref:Uncharacterized protein n=1 Tax=Ramalina farinacea TaxID=258253 RepID=A0AA43QRL4_9LECA|nr:hypothetical protein [Ramalina farinacea]